jgi:GTP-binding protein
MSDRARLVIVGRPNVGKSTLFNRLLGRRRALVHDEPGVTRDRLEEKTEWKLARETTRVTLVDTGGLGGDRFAEEIDRQVKLALEETDVVLVVFDAQTGLTPADEDVVRKLRTSGLEAPLIGVVNKVDAEVHESLLADFYATGLENVLTVSAEHGRGIDELMFAVREALGGRGRAEEESPEEGPSEPSMPRLAIVGRPNVGKSTMINALLGRERMITSPIAGTTVDAVDSVAELDGGPVLLIDTAGIRRKSKTEQGVEVLSVVQARKALERCDVAVLLLDGEKGITDQDEKIGGLIEEIGCGVVLALNKWDTQRRNPKFTKEMAAKRVRKQMAYLRYAPVMFVSAKEGEGFEGLGDLVREIVQQRRTKVATKEFTEWVREESGVHNPMNAKFYMCHQSGRNPPTFVCHVNDPEKVHFSLQRHLVNGIRARWGFMGSPVRLLFVAGKSAATR